MKRKPDSDTTSRPTFWDERHQRVDLDNICDVPLTELTDMQLKDLASYPSKGPNGLSSGSAYRELHHRQLVKLAKHQRNVAIAVAVLVGGTLVIEFVKLAMSFS